MKIQRFIKGSEPVVFTLAAALFILPSCNDFKLPDKDKPQEIEIPDYIENGVNFGQGKMIGKVIWAPVNAGATEEDRNGTLLDYDAAKSCCPDGWHLPSEQEFISLVQNVDTRVVQYGGAEGRWCTGSMLPIEQEGDVTEENGGLAVPAVFLNDVPSESQVGLKFKYWTSTSFWYDDSAAAFIFGLYDMDVTMNRVFDKPVTDKYMVRCVHNLSTYTEPYILSFDVQSVAIFSDATTKEVAVTLTKPNGTAADLSEWDNVYRILPSISENTGWLRLSLNAEKGVVTYTASENTTASSRTQTVVYGHTGGSYAVFNIVQSRKF